MENRIDESVELSHRVDAMMEVLNRLHEAEELQLEHARTRNGRFFSLINLMLNHGVGQFISRTKNNRSVKLVCLDIGHQRIYDDEHRPQDGEEYYRLWEKLADGLGNLEGLIELRVNSRELLDDPEDLPDYRALGKVLQRVPQLQNLSFCCSLMSLDGIGEVAEALHQHPNLKQIQFEQRTDADALDVIARQLITVPNLESVEFGFMMIQRRSLPTAFFSLVGMPSLRVLKMHKCHLREGQGQMMAQQLGQRESKLNLLNLQHSRIDGREGAHILQGLLEHRTITTLQLSLHSLNQESCHTLASLISESKSLKKLKIAGRSFIDQDSSGGEAVEFNCDCLDPLFDALQRTVSVRALSIGDFDEWSHQLTMKFRVALASHDCSLQCLTINAHDIAPAWSDLTPVLDTNTSLKKLCVAGGIDRHGAIAIASHLSRNRNLEQLTMMVARDAESSDSETRRIPRRYEDGPSYFHRPLEFTMATCIEALGHNTTIKSVALRFPHCWEVQDVTREGTRVLEAAFAKSYSLEKLSGRYDRDSMVPVLCHLNRAGRKYLTEDHFDHDRGVQVLTAVNECLNALYFHLSENPSLCEGALERYCAPGESETTTIQPKTIKRSLAQENDTRLIEGKRRCMASDD